MRLESRTDYAPRMVSQHAFVVSMVDVAQLVAKSTAFDLPVADRVDAAGEAWMPNGLRTTDGFAARFCGFDGGCSSVG